MDSLRAIILLLILFLVATGCEVRRVNDGSAPGESLTTSDVATTQATVPPPADPAASSRTESILQSLRNLFPRRDEYNTVRVPPNVTQRDVDRLLEPDVQLYQVKKQISQDLLSVDNENRSVCRTDFSGFIDHRETAELANQMATQTLEEDRADWLRALDEARGNPGGGDVPAQAAAGDSIAGFAATPQFISDVARIETNYANFEIQNYVRPHFQQIQISDVNERAARLVVDTQGKVTMNDSNNRSQVLLQHPIVLTYYFVSDRGGWKCIAVDPSFNPYRKNQRWQAELEDCENEYSRARKIAQCKAEVNAKYDQPVGSTSNNVAASRVAVPPESW